MSCEKVGNHIFLFLKQSSTYQFRLGRAFILSKPLADLKRGVSGGEASAAASGRLALKPTERVQWSVEKIAYPFEDPVYVFSE